MSYELEVVESKGVCCGNARTLDHFCGNGSLLKRDMRSRCNKCGKDVYAEAWKSNDNPPRVYLRKYCLEHGVTSSRLSSDSAFYYLPSPDGTACGCGPGGCKPTPLGDNAKTASQLHTCTLVVEIVRDCNLACPTCYAGSPQRKGHHVDTVPIETLKAQITAVLDEQGDLDILQLSGGEPTLHPQLFEILDWTCDEPRIKSVLLNTNGTLIAQPEFVAQMALRIPEGRFGVYLQYDGPQKPGQMELRGGDFREIRRRALDNCRAHKMPVALVMTVSHENKFECSGAINEALEDENITWVVFQPEFLSGRNDKRKLFENPINVADIVHSAARDGIMTLDSWMPLPCSDPNCGTVGFLVRIGGTWQSVAKLVDLGQFIPAIANRVNIDVSDSLAGCGCEGYNLGAYLKQYGIERADVKILFIKPFMDTRTWDEARIASCCTHVLTREGIKSFCQHYGSR